MCEWHGLQYLQIQRYFSFWGKLSLSNTQTRERKKTSHINQEWGDSPSLNRRQITVCVPTGEFVNCQQRKDTQTEREEERQKWKLEDLIRSSFKVLPKRFSLTEVCTLWSTDNTWNWFLFGETWRCVLQCLLNTNLLIEACWVRDEAFRFEISLD